MKKYKVYLQVEVSGIEVRELIVEAETKEEAKEIAEANEHNSELIETDITDTINVFVEGVEEME